jgi:putative AlgH/UPF0301 family transcriptional regulator
LPSTNKILHGLRTAPFGAKCLLVGGLILLTLPGLARIYEGHDGKFLVSTERTRGTPFEKTVIYLERNDFGGSHGVIINKPIEGTEFFDGGPVGKDIVLERSEGAKKRIFIGHAGWLPLQLDFEILRGGWVVVDYDPALMFDTPPEKIWDKAAERADVKITAIEGGT